MAANEKRKSLASNAALNVVRTVVTYAFPLVSFMYGSRLFGTDGVGQIQFAQSFVAYFVLLAMLGIEKYGIRESSRVKDDRQKLSKLSQELLIINGCSVVLAYGLLLASLVLIPKLDSYAVLLLINSLTIGLTALGMNWLYVAVEDYFFVMVRNVVVNTLALVCLFVFVRSSDDIAVFVLIQTLAATGANVFNVFHARKYISFRPMGHYHLAPHIKPILVVFAMTLFIEVYTHLDTTMLGFMSGNDATGLYSAAHKVCGMLTAVITAAALVMMPRMSAHAGAGDRGKVAKLSADTIHFILMFSIPCAVGAFVLSENLILLFSGSEFLEGATAARILSGRVLLSSLNAFFVLYLFIPLGKEKVSVLSTGCAAVLNFALNMALIPLLAENGASIATVMAELLELCVNLWFFRKVLPPGDAFSKCWKYAVASAVVPLLFGLTSLIGLNAYIQLLGVFLLAIPLYFGGLVMLKDSYVTSLARKLLRRGRGAE